MKIYFSYYKKHINIRTQLLLVIALVNIFFYFHAFPAIAENYDIYVDKNYSGSEEEGSEDKPFKTIKKAVDKAGDSKSKIYVKNGTYEEQVTLIGNLEIHGQDKNKTIIKNNGFSETVILRGNNKLKKITVSGGRTAVVFYGEGSLEDCFIIKKTKKGG